MNSALARKTIRSIETALEEEKTTAISEIVRIIQELASKAFSISTTELSQLIGRDPTITEKVISAANTMGFNPMGPSICTIPEAIHTIGFEKARNLAISILLIENASAAQNSFEQRESASLAVCSGLLAQRLTEKRDSGLDPDLTFVCASLRNYGRLLLSTFLVDSYREARALSCLNPQEEAFSQVFGLTHLNLGSRILDRSNLTKSIMFAMRPLPPELREKPARTTNETLLALSDFSVGISELAFDDSIDPEHFADALEQRIGQYSEILDFEIDDVQDSLELVSRDLQLVSRDLGSSWVNIPAVANIQARVLGEKLPDKPAGSRISAPEAPLDQDRPVSRMSERERERFAEECFQKASASLETNLNGDSADLSGPFQAVADCIQDSLGLSNCLVFVPEESDPDSYSPRFGNGDLLKCIRNRPIASIHKRDIFSICIERKEDILIQDVGAGKIRSVIPDWIEQYGQSHSILLLPVVDADRPYAILFGALDEGSIHLEANDHRRLKELRFKLNELRTGHESDQSHS